MIFDELYQGFNLTIVELKSYSMEKFLRYKRGFNLTIVELKFI